MRFSNQNNFCFLLFALLASCASSSYKVTNRDGGRVELSVSPDRIVLECEYVSENREIPYGFMIHILDDANTVINTTQTNTLSREACRDRLTKIGRILKTGRQIYIAGIGDIDDPRKSEKQTYEFPAHGTFPYNGCSLQFFNIANEHGLCYAAHTADAKPCPDGENFAIRDKRY